MAVYLKVGFRRRSLWYREGSMVFCTNKNKELKENTEPWFKLLPGLQVGEPGHKWGSHKIKRKSYRMDEAVLSEKAKI